MPADPAPNPAGPLSPAPAEFHIASLLVHASPAQAARVSAVINAMPGAEVHAEQQGKIVVSVEGPSEGFIANRMTDMHLLDGVFSAVLVFHHVEPAVTAGCDHS